MFGQKIRMFITLLMVVPIPMLYADSLHAKGPQVKEPKLSAIKAEIKVPKVEHVIPIVVNPSAAANKDIAKAIGPVLAEGTKAAGVNPHATKQTLPTVADPMPTVIAVGKQTVVQMGQANVEQLKSDLMLAEGVIKGDLQQVGTAIRDLAGAQTDQGLNPAVIYLADVVVGLTPLPKTPDLLEVPEVTLFEPENKKFQTKGLLDPKIVYYVNGMLTPKDVGASEAKALADYLGRPVGLIHNINTSQADESVQAIYDRAWPIALAGGMGMMPKVVQANKTTRQVTHLLTYANSNISIVSHSQGGLIVRNALITANRLRGDSWLEKGMRWVATGAPLRHEEVFAKVNRYTPVAHQNDSVAHGLGIRLMRKEDEQNALNGHDLREAYLKRIPREALW